MAERSRRRLAAAAPSRSDREWGRLPRLAPPLSTWVPPLLWLASSLVLLVVVLAVVTAPGPLDDPDPAYQRPGFLISRGDARHVPNLRLPGDPIGRRPTIIFFDRRLPDAEAFRTLEQKLPTAIATVLVISRGPQAAHAETSVVVDRQERIADAVGMRRPRDGGPPVGYAIVDRDARVRYATLDPGYLHHQNEGATMANAVA